MRALAGQQVTVVADGTLVDGTGSLWSLTPVIVTSGKLTYIIVVSRDPLRYLAALRGAEMVFKGGVGYD